MHFYECYPSRVVQHPTQGQVIVLARYLSNEVVVVGREDGTTFNTYPAKLVKGPLSEGLEKKLKNMLDSFNYRGGHAVRKGSH